MADAQIVDAIVEPLYDTNTIPAAGVLTLTYFALPIGQGASVFAAAGVTKSLSDTNMDLAGQLSAGYNFDLLGFRAQPAFGIVSADACSWSFGGTFTFTIASKPYLRVPLDTIPAGMGVAGYAATAVGGPEIALVLHASSHGAPHLSNSFTIGKKPLRLSQSQNFSVVLNWPIVVTNTTVKPTAAAIPGIALRIYMDGFKFRPVQ